jgi:acyl-coenzyme A synthetase/AMP-(fatty) acid ligase
MLAPTVAFNHVAMEEPEAFARLRILHVGGDVLSPTACGAVFDAGFDGALCNLYGPTETTTAATVHKVINADTSITKVPIGGALSGSVLRVLDAKLYPAIPGCIGELYIGGSGVARGYLQDGRRTAERFLPDPMGQPGSVIYRTGDLVVERGDGALDYVGRSDEQLKIRGYRVEPREVECALLAHPGVREVAVLTSGGGQDRALIAFVVLTAGLGPAKLRQYAEEALPDYQVPASFVEVGHIPATEHGKRDGEALLADLALRDASRRDYQPPETADEKYLAEVWEDLLRVEMVGKNDDFFVLGGHSMLAFRLSRRVIRDQQFELPIVEILQNPVLTEMALALGRAQSSG